MNCLRRRPLSPAHLHDAGPSVQGARVHDSRDVANGARNAIVNLVNLDGDDEIASVISVRDFDEDVDLLFCSKKGLVGRTLSDYRNIVIGLASLRLRRWRRVADGAEDAHGAARSHPTRAGKCIRFQGINDDGELEVRHMGRVARGVRGIKLKGTDEIAGLEMLESDASMLLLTVTENGYGKRTAIDKYRVQGRGGQGVINMVVDDRNGGSRLRAGARHRPD